LDERLAKKADASALYDKIGRGEVGELLEALAARLQAAVGRSERRLEEMREEIDSMLALLLQNGDVASGMFKCLSCAKVVSFTKPSPAAGSGRM
jgi:uncharacterized protein CbrC (UPF0167 family)